MVGIGLKSLIYNNRTVETLLKVTAVTSCQQTAAAGLMPVETAIPDCGIRLEPVPTVRGSLLSLI